MAKRNSIGVAIAIGFGIERSGMGFGREKLDVNPTVIEYLGCAFRLCERKKSQRHAKEFDSDTDADSECKPPIDTKLH